LQISENNSRVVISVNGSIIPYIECRRGLKQGYHLSPYLFILAANRLNKILFRGIQHNHFSDLGLIFSNGQQVLNLQYADDTLLFLKVDSRMLEKIKWALKEFEGISDLKINFAKSELIPLNISTSDATAPAALFQCKIGRLPMKYLGLPLH
jgi:Reverse transcriptase (RNA-dependent DNA polymerase)